MSTALALKNSAHHRKSPSAHVQEALETHNYFRRARVYKNDRVERAAGGLGAGGSSGRPPSAADPPEPAARPTVASAARPGPEPAPARSRPGASALH